MLNSKTIKIMLVILLSIILLGVSTSVFATTPQTNTNGVTVITDPNQTTNTNTTNPIANTTTNTTTNTQNRLTNSNSYANSNLPQTGSADYVIIGFVVICIISAIYAYKKVRDYKM